MNDTTTTKKKVTIYSTSSCKFCNLAKDYFKEHAIAYTEYNVGTDQEKLKQMVELTGTRSVPVIQVNNEAMVGFAPDAFEQLYARA